MSLKRYVKGVTAPRTPENGVLTWDEYFMGVAKLSGMRSKDPSTQVGACIVDSRSRIIGVGYNGLPRGLNDNEYPWSRGGEFLDSKYTYVVHAEVNAILNSTKDLDGSKLYVSLFPCNECAKAIVQSGIREVIYSNDKYKGTDQNIASKRILEDAGVLVRLIDDVNIEILLDK